MDNVIHGIVKRKKHLVDEFNRIVTVVYCGDEVLLVQINGWLTNDFVLNKQRMIIEITSELFIKQPKWWQFWKKHINPTVKIKLTL